MNNKEDKEYQSITNDTSISEESPEKLDSLKKDTEMAKVEDYKLIIKFKLMQGSERSVELTKK